MSGPDSGRRWDSVRFTALGIIGLGAVALSAMLTDGRITWRDGSGTVTQISAAEFAEYAERVGYRIETVRHGQPVPRVMLTALPEGLAQITSVEQRKHLFLEGLLPVVLSVNESIAAERAELLALKRRREAGLPLSARDAVWLAELATRYDIASEPGAGVTELLRRVDIIPVSLALAQAAIESGWGTSRFAQQGNALFGQRTYDGSGLQPVGVSPDAAFRVRDFGDLASSVRAYADNLNTNEAYRDFRAVRDDMRRRGQAPDGLTLAQSLDRYSERGDAYIDQIRDVIRQNNLAALDGARLADRSSVALQTTNRGAVPIPRSETAGNI